MADRCKNITLAATSLRPVITNIFSDVNVYNIAVKEMECIPEVHDNLETLAVEVGKSLSLQDAVKTSCVPLVKLILQSYGTGDNHPGLENFNKNLSQCLYEAVQIACKGGTKYLPMVRYLLDIGADVNLYKSTQQNYLTPLHLAINSFGCQCQEQLVTWLLEAKADVSGQNADGYGIIHYSIKCTVNVIEAIIKAGASPISSTQKVKAETPLHMACHRTDGSEPIIRLLMEHIHNQYGLDPKYVNPARTDGWAPLHILTGERSPRTSDNLVNITDFLISNGADINLRTTSGETPLLLAIKPVSSLVRLFVINLRTTISNLYVEYSAISS